MTFSIVSAPVADRPGDNRRSGRHVEISIGMMMAWFLARPTKHLYSLPDRDPDPQMQQAIRVEASPRRKIAFRSRRKSAPFQ